MPLVYFVDSHSTLHQDRLTGTALTNDKVSFSGFENSVDVVEHLNSVVKRLRNIFNFNHVSNNLVSMKFEPRIIMLLLTTAFVLFLPTSRAPPFTV